MIYIVDTAFFIGLSVPLDKMYYTTPTIVSEVKQMEARMLLDNMLNSQILKIMDPTSESIQKVKAKALKIKDKRLSEADFSVLALAEDLKNENPVVLTDDYTLQNLLKHLNIRFEGIFHSKIKKKVKYN